MNTNVKPLFNYKFEKQTVLYHIYEGAYRITSKPMSLVAIKTLTKTIRRLEASGYRIIRAN